MRYLEAIIKTVNLTEKYCADKNMKVKFDLNIEDLYNKSLELISKVGNKNIVENYKYGIVEDFSIPVTVEVNDTVSSFIGVFNCLADVKHDTIDILVNFIFEDGSSFQIPKHGNFWVAESIVKLFLKRFKNKFSKEENEILNRTINNHYELSNGDNKFIIEDYDSFEEALAAMDMITISKLFDEVKTVDKFRPIYRQWMRSVSDPIWIGWIGFVDVAYGSKEPWMVLHYNDNNVVVRTRTLKFISGKWVLCDAKGHIISFNKEN